MVGITAVINIWLSREKRVVERSSSREKRVVVERRE
jgi:hypothetical protein